jgi:hypothetical protein
MGDATIRTNTIESFFGIFKRGMKGVYQHCGAQHLQRYITEFDFRYSNRSGLGTVTTSAQRSPCAASLASASPMDGLVQSPPKYPALAGAHHQGRRTIGRVARRPDRQNRHAGCNNFCSRFVPLPCADPAGLRESEQESNKLSRRADSN